MSLHFIDNRSIISGIDDNRDCGVVLCRRTQHGWAADIDIFNCIGKTAVRFGYGFHKRVEIDDYHINLFDIVLFHLGDMFRQVAAAQETAMNLRMQGFYPAVEHFREAGVVGDLNYF